MLPVSSVNCLNLEAHCYDSCPWVYYFSAIFCFLEYLFQTGSVFRVLFPTSAKLKLSKWNVQKFEKNNPIF